MLTDIYIWSQLDITKHVLKDLDTEIKRAEQEILDGQLVVSGALEREYCRAIGYIDGLKFIKKTIEEAIETDESRESA